MAILDRGSDFKLTHAKSDALEITRLLADYTKRMTEQAANLLVYGFLSARWRNVSREWWVHVKGRKRPLRIDFRVGGTNPALIEFALRPKTGHRSALSFTSNVTELKKLARVPGSQVRWRYLLLIDLCWSPLDFDFLKREYDAANLGVGRFPRRPVRVIYSNRTGVYDFLFWPHSK